MDPTENRTIIQTEQVYFSYRNEEETTKRLPLVLNNISLSVEKGSFVAVLGHNGCGKSTLAKHFNAILIPDRGTVRVEGMETSDEGKTFAIRQKVGMVFQNPDNQIVAAVVEEDVAFALENLGIAPPEIRERVDWALESVGMKERSEDAPHQLSGGQKQRVAIAGIIAMRPDCIVLDEPTAMLDPKGRREVMKTIRMLNKEFGITIILITHYMEEAAQADRTLVMDGGQILLDGSPRYVFSHVDLLKNVGLDVPQATELIHEMNKYRFEIREDIITEEECIEELSKLLEESNCRLSGQKD